MATSMRATLALPVGDRDHVRGPADAPVTLVEYGDFRMSLLCCGPRHPQKVQQIMGSQLRSVPSLPAHADTPAC